MNRDIIYLFLIEWLESLRVDCDFFKFIENLESINYPAKHGVLHIETRMRRVRDEELREIAVGAAVGVGKNASSIMLQVFVKLVFEFPPDRPTSLACVGVVARLNDKSLNIPEELASIVVVGRAQREKIFRCFWRFRAVKFNLNIAVLCV
jgi:hypothetical protein